jgi:hypothetical protein
MATTLVFCTRTQLSIERKLRWYLTGTTFKLVVENPGPPVTLPLTYS